MEIEKGYKTTELPTSVIPAIVGMLVAFGVIEPENSDAIVELGTRIIGGVMALVLLYTYIRGRVEIKKTIVNANASVEMSKCKQLG